MQRVPMVKGSRPAVLTVLLSALLIPASGQVAGAPAGERWGRLFPDMEGWERSEAIQVFVPENLFDYIDGAADLYLTYDFEQLQVAEYGDAQGQLLAVEIYRHRTPLHAFGIYSQERPEEGRYLEVGAQGYLQESILNFVSGKYYVKLIAYSHREAGSEKVLLAFAEKVAKQLDAEPSWPPILDCFPQQDKRSHSEKFIARDFLGYRFLRSAFTADYGDSNRTFTLFVIEGDNTEACADMLSQYLQLLEGSPKEPREGIHTLSDPHHGEIGLSWLGNYIWGVLHLSEGHLRRHYLTMMEKRLIELKFIEQQP